MFSSYYLLPLPVPTRPEIERQANGIRTFVMNVHALYTYVPRTIFWVQLWYVRERSLCVRQERSRQTKYELLPESYKIVPSLQLLLTCLLIIHSKLYIITRQVSRSCKLGIFCEVQIFALSHSNMLAFCSHLLPHNSTMACLP